MKKAYILILTLLIITLESTSQPVIGLQLGSVGKQIKSDVPGTLKKLSEWGVKELETNVPAGMEAPAFLKLLEENDITLIATGADFKELESDPQKVADRAKALGAKQVICYWIPHTGDIFTIDDAKKGVAVFNSAGEVLKKNSLALGYHAHGYEFQQYDGAPLFDYLAKHFNPQFVNFQMDVFWMKQSGNDPVALLNKYPGRFISMHLKDRRKGSPDSNNGRADVEVNVVLGTGDVGIEAILKAGYKAGIKHFFIEDESSRQWEQVPQSVAYLKTIRF
jgi:sugar phosphate isomerase/epimerase